MPCMNTLKKGQTIGQRASEIRKRVSVIDALLASRRVQLKIGPQGAVTFTGITAEDRDGMTDACIFRTLSSTGSAAAKMALARAEQLAGRTVDRKQVTAGVHSHDGGATWHPRG